MKKKRLFLLLLQLFIASVGFAQISKNVPQNVRERLLEVRKEVKLSLDSCRTSSRSWYSISFLSYKFHNGSGNSLEIDEKLAPLNLNWQMVFDDAMIKRTIQLLNNEYRKDEADTIVNRQMAVYGEPWFNGRAMEALKLDTIKGFFQLQDSLDRHKDKELHPRPYQYYEVGLYLKQDTTARFKFLLDSVRIAKKTEVGNVFLNRYNFYVESLVRACGYINDKRLVPPLINLLEKARKGDDKKMVDLVTESLVRMNVEPYCSDYLAVYSHSLQEIKEMEYTRDMWFLTDIVATQASLLELSKYLQSSAYSRIKQPGESFDVIDHYYGIAYDDAYKLIIKQIENKELLDIINATDFELERDRFKIYDWMQENYGKYKIKRVW